MLESESLLQCRICHDQCFYATLESLVSGRQTLATSRKALIISEINKGNFDWSPSAFDAIYSALNSGIQHEFCVHAGHSDGWPDETTYVRSARQAIVRSGRVPPYVESVRTVWKRCGNPHGTDDINVVIQKDAARAPVFFFLDSATRKWIEHQADIIASIAAQVGPAAKIFGGGSSGFELYDLGYIEEAKMSLSRLAKECAGAELIVSDSPEAVWMINEGKHQTGNPTIPKAQDLLTYLDELVERRPELQLVPTADGVSLRGHAVTYHDPSYLGRYGRGSYETPRRIVRDILGGDLREMTYTRRLAFPAGPYLGFPSERDAIEIGKRRVADALATGSEFVLTASPFDYFNLRRASADAIQILYLPSLVRLQTVNHA